MEKTYQSGKRDRDRESFTRDERPSGVLAYTREDWSNPDARHASLANGLIGLRLGGVPFHHGQAMVNGYVGRSAATGVEACAEAPFPLQADLVLQTQTTCRLSERPDMIRMGDQTLDTAFGELTTTFTFGPPDHNVRVEVVTFCCRSLPTVCCQEIRFRVDSPLKLDVETIMDPRGLAGRCLERQMFQTKLDCMLWWESRGGLSTVGAGFFTEVVGLDDYVTRQNNWGNESELCLRNYRLDLEPSRVVSIRQYGALVPSMLQHEPHIAAIHLLHHVKDVGFDRLRHDNRQAWLDLWKARPIIHAPQAPDASKLQEYADSAFYYVHSSIHRSSPMSLAPFGLTRCDAEACYGGHPFTSDCEFYTFPGLLLSNPGAARAILDYRFRQLDDYRNNALAMGQDGLLIPNQTGMYGSDPSRPDAEGCLGASAFKNHFVADAFLQYADAHGDEDFLRERAWPVVKGTADWMVSRVERTDRGYEVRNLYLNEQYGNTHNEPPVSMAFQRVLRAAAALAERLGKRSRPQWRRVAEQMLILTDPEDLRRETSWFSQTYKAFDRATTAEGLIQEMQGLSGTPISCLRPSFAALRMGRRDLAAEWWPREVASKYLPQWFGTWREWATDWSSGGRSYPLHQDCFITFAGHLLKQLVMQFPRLEVNGNDPAQWPTAPVTLPEGWERIEVERLWIQDRPARLVADHGKYADLIWLD